jgi:hypothetical protein
MALAGIRVRTTFTLLVGTVWIIREFKWWMPTHQRRVHLAALPPR